MEVDAASTPDGDAPAAAEAVDAATAASGARPQKARGAVWSDTYSRALTAATLAARSAGGSCARVVVCEDGTWHVEVDVKHSKESVPPLVDAHENTRLAAAAAEERRQQRWIEKVEQKSRSTSAPAASPAPSGPSKSARKRERKRLKNEEQAAQLRLLQEEKAAADSQREAHLQGLLRQALTRVTEMAKSAAAADRNNKKIVARHAVLEQDGEPQPVAVLADTVGSACSDEEFGDKLRKAIDGTPADRLTAALEHLVTKDLFLPRCPRTGVVHFQWGSPGSKAPS